MFRRVEDTLESDPVFDTDLKKLGFFVNNLGHIRMIEAPDKPYIYHSTNNDRVNEVLREAMQTCQREEAEKRMRALGLHRVYLPGFTMDKHDGPHVPILAPSPDILKRRRRVIVLVNDAMQDLGILAYRQLQRELGVNGGSIVNFAKEIIKRSSTESSVETDDIIFKDGYTLENDDNVPSLIVMNTGQLLYSHKHNRAMTMRSWSAMPRKSVAHDMIRIHEQENRVRGHEAREQHVKTIFDEVICNPDRVAPDAEVYVIAIEDGTESVLKLLQSDFDKYGSRITAMALIHASLEDSGVQDPSLRAFLQQRTRQWKFSDITPDPWHCIGLPNDYEGTADSPPPDTHSIMKSTEHVRWNENLNKLEPTKGVMDALRRLVLSIPKVSKQDSPVTDTFEPYADWPTGLVCPTFAGGESSVCECVFTDANVQHAILSFFEDVSQNPKHYRNPEFKIYTQAPQPSLDNPLELSGDEASSFLSLPPEMTLEQAQLDEARIVLSELRIALAACPDNVPELKAGREKLIKKVQKKELEIGDMETKALATGGLKAGEVSEKRENWKPKVEGPKVPFAGSMVDSELLKAAGLFETAKAELEKLGEKDEEKDEEKAFL